MERFRKHNKITTFLSNFRKSNHQIIHTLSKPSPRNSKKERQGKAIREEGSSTYITKTRREDFQNIKKTTTFLSIFRTSNHQIKHMLSKPSRKDSKKERQGKAREEGSTTYITKTRRKYFENIIKTRHFSVISERQKIRSYKRLANHYKETQKKYAKEKPSGGKVQLRISQKHVWNDF